MTVQCDECEELFANANAEREHYCPIYYTRPGMTMDAMFTLFTEFLARVNLVGYAIVTYHFPPDRATMIVEVGIDLDRFGPAVRHDRREQERGDRN